MDGGFHDLRADYFRFQYVQRYHKLGGPKDFSAFGNR